MGFYSPLGYFAANTGVPEPALRLLLSIFITYPMAIVYNYRYIGQDVNAKNVYFFICGLSIGVFNFGLGIYHSLLSVLIMYALINYLGPSKHLVMASFFYNMGYLLLGYYFTESESYDIIWTMPQCVLTLRLIGLSYDLFDGTKPEESLSATNKTTALRRVPTFMELAGFVYFPASFLIGPQFSMRKYLSFLQSKENEGAPKKPNKFEAGLKRLLLGIIYLAAYQVGSTYFSNEYMVSNDFKSSSFFRKHIVLGLWGKFALYKYISVWLLTEGAGIMFGVAFNGTKDNVAQWDGFSNVKLQIFEGATRFGNFIESFNVNTNNWVASYVYKRLAFLGNKQISQVSTLLFLALWHGFHSGYYMTFFMEFIIMFMEKELEDILKKSPALQAVISNNMVSPFLYIALKLYTTVFMGYCMVPFCLLHFSSWWDVYSTLNFSGFVFFLPWPFVYKPLLKLALSRFN